MVIIWIINALIWEVVVARKLIGRIFLNKHNWNGINACGCVSRTLLHFRFRFFFSCFWIHLIRLVLVLDCRTIQISFSENWCIFFYELFGNYGSVGYFLMDFYKLLLCDVLIVRNCWCGKLVVAFWSIRLTVLPTIASAVLVSDIDTDTCLTPSIV